MNADIKAIAIQTKAIFFSLKLNAPNIKEVFIMTVANQSFYMKSDWSRKILQLFKKERKGTFQFTKINRKKKIEREKEDGKM